MVVVNRIKNALEREALLLRSKGEDTMKKEMTYKLASLCRVLRVSEHNKRELEKYLETLLTAKVNSGGN
jgi:hypothetical protein